MMMADLPINKILQGDALTVLKEFPDESIDRIVKTTEQSRIIENWIINKL